MLKLRNVRKSYGATVAVDGLSLEIVPGEIFGLLGPNGAGKSTAVHLAVGLLRPDSGEVEIEGLGSPSLPRVRARIGVAPQALSLYEPLTAGILSWSRSRGVFAGVSLDGSTLRQDVGDNREPCGRTLENREIIEKKIAAPAARELVSLLTKYSPERRESS